MNTYLIGRSWRELPITCIELSKKTIIPTTKPGIAVIVNIHSGEPGERYCKILVDE